MTGLQDSFTSLAQPGLLTILIWKGLVDTLHFEQLVGHKQTNTFAIRNNRQSCGLPPTPVNSRRKVGASALPRSTVPDCAFAEAFHQHRNLGSSGFAAGSALGVKEALVSKAKTWE
jgi:hypothetical protein